MHRMRIAPTSRRRDGRAHICLCLALGAAMSACRANATPAEARTAVPDGEVQIAPDSPKRGSLEIESVQPAMERVIATLPAQVLPDEGHTVRVASPVTGRIMTLDVSAGDHVHRGQALAHIHAADAVQVTSDVAKALAAWNVARASLARTTDLYEPKVSAARELEQAKNDEAQAHAEYERAHARATQLGMTTDRVTDTYVLRAPVDGVVLDRTANPGAEVRPDNGQPLFTISWLDAVWLVVSVPQRDLAQVH